jgi:hypothetical protein
MDRLTVLSSDLHALLAAQLDARSLLSLFQTSRAFRDDAERIARGWLLAKHGPRVARRWHHLTWRERLWLEASAVGFDRARCTDFTFADDDASVSLNVLGPRLLLSNATTRDSPILAWRFFVRGNAAVELGVVPDDAVYDHKALHRSAKAPADGLPAGFYSDITLKSTLPFTVPIQKNSYVEVVATRGAVHLLVEKPPCAGALLSARGFTVPDVFRMTLDYGSERNVRLALTAWVNAKFEFV